MKILYYVYGKNVLLEGLGLEKNENKKCHFYFTNGFSFHS